MVLKDKGENMARRRFNRGLQVFAVLLVFALGFLCGTLTQQSADAQLKEMGQGALQKAAPSGGTAGKAVELGTAITDMQKHVDGLQKNISTLKSIQSAFGG
jgi:hypothetical protein